MVRGGGAVGGGMRGVHEDAGQPVAASRDLISLRNLNHRLKMSASEPRVALMPQGCEVNSKVHLNRGATAAARADSGSLKSAAGRKSRLFFSFHF